MVIDQLKIVSKSRKKILNSFNNVSIVNQDFIYYIDQIKNYIKSIILLIHNNK